MLGDQDKLRSSAREGTPDAPLYSEGGSSNRLRQPSARALSFPGEWHSSSRRRISILIDAMRFLIPLPASSLL